MEYTLHLPDDVARQLQRCRASIRVSIQKALQNIVESAAAKRPVRKATSVTTGPPLRLYVFEGFRLSYQVDPATRRVVVLDMQAATG
jgi:mRNA-degrading endonuclease RelE of RelBE toxin-antitoxin system